MEGTRGFASVTTTKLSKPQGKLLVGYKVTVEDLNMTRAVHWLETKRTLFVLDHIHIVLELFPMARLLPKRSVIKLRGFDFLISVSLELVSDIGLNGAEQLMSTGMPEHRPRCVLLKMKEF